MLCTIHFIVQQLEHTVPCWPTPLYSILPCFILYAVLEQINDDDHDDEYDDSRTASDQWDAAYIQKGGAATATDQTSSVMQILCTVIFVHISDAAGRAVGHLWGAERRRRQSIRIYAAAYCCSWQASIVRRGDVRSTAAQRRLAARRRLVEKWVGARRRTGSGRRWRALVTQCQSVRQLAPAGLTAGPATHTHSRQSITVSSGLLVSLAARPCGRQAAATAACWSLTLVVLGVPCPWPWCWSSSPNSAVVVDRRRFQLPCREGSRRSRFIEKVSTRSACSTTRCAFASYIHSAASARPASYDARQRAGLSPQHGCDDVIMTSRLGAI